MENAYRVLGEETESWAYNYNRNLLTTVSSSPFSLSSLRKLADIHKCINTSLLLFFSFAEETHSPERAKHAFEAEQGLS